MVSYWTKECGRQNTKDTSKLTGSPVSIESICEIAHSDNSEVTIMIAVTINKTITLYHSAEIAGGAVDSVVKK
mgnify:CR=1 FL=1